LPKEIRQQIYSYLLASSLDSPASVTTINYTLEWPHLESASSSTFLPYSLDRCQCQRAREDHIYTRYICDGPIVRFASKKETAWVLYKPGPQFNILRPASSEELQHRPSASILRTSKLIYEEAVSFLYQWRSFLFLSGPSPRGRYQAYATLTWLGQLTKLARAHVNSIALICQNFEEDCRNTDVARSYARLSQFVISELPLFRSLQVVGWDGNVPLDPLFMLLRKRNETEIVLKETLRDRGVRISDPSAVFGPSTSIDDVLDDTTGNRASWHSGEE
jgi:hypothetical protein